ncbi:ribosomal protein S8 [Durotheca rogersii]|uniref:ribosomal protein S8 n=1 Tax=Durotheca rogersii TaxID=419775 RepID=UPI00221E8334|nr:ribosomal protein S8 [Durotheca rogersii]KAI5857377.1 ribosomal protein S8 [Durotheca rogersii]
MGLPNIANMCSHLQNAARAKLGLTSVPHTKYNVRLALAMQRAGFLSFVTRGTKQPPDPATVGAYEPPPVTTKNVANQRLWLGLKYNPDTGEPVLGTMMPITKSKRPVTIQLPAINRIARGFDSHPHRGLSIGEAIMINTSLGTLEVREASKRGVGGLMLCRIGPPKLTRLGL